MNSINRYSTAYPSHSYYEKNPFTNEEPAFDLQAQNSNHNSQKSDTADDSFDADMNRYILHFLEESNSQSTGTESHVENAPIPVESAAAGIPSRSTSSLNSEKSDVADDDFDTAMDEYILRFLQESNSQSTETSNEREHHIENTSDLFARSLACRPGLEDEIQSANAHRLEVFNWLKAQGGTKNKNRLKEAAALLHMTPLTFENFYTKFLNGRLSPLKKLPYNITKHESSRRKRPEIEDTFSDTENFMEDPDRISATDSCLSLSNEFRKKVFEILKRAGGLKNTKATEAAILASGYERSSLKHLFKRSERGDLPPLKRKLYGFKEKDPNSLADECNKRIRYLKKECFTSTGSTGTS